MSWLHRLHLVFEMLEGCESAYQLNSRAPLRVALRKQSPYGVSTELVMFTAATCAMRSSISARVCTFRRIQGNMHPYTMNAPSVMSHAAQPSRLKGWRAILTNVLLNSEMHARAHWCGVGRGVLPSLPVTSSPTGTAYVKPSSQDRPRLRK